MADISPGQVISLKDGQRATVRYAGTTHFAEGNWIGVELEGPTGKNDGSVAGERYFECSPFHGMFLRPVGISRVLEHKPRPTAASGVKRSSTVISQRSSTSSSIPPRVSIYRSFIA